jgi:hypothetical protein
MVGSYSLLETISVAMEPWTIFETFIQTGSSVVLTQHRFRTPVLVDMAPFRLETQY